jgi:rhamnose utilization protein RhaD (predicted bifunctional aldolase and dehydrogenase)/NAD(P)-dependent dehydrogenase (short-subunit alcohol dehydrogenase family)
MKSLWDDQEAARFEERGDLGLRVYTSRLLGRDRSLVLHGGGNTSVKVRERNLLGDEEDVLYVKGSGWDLETIEEAGFAPVRLEPLRRLARLDDLSDPQMVNELATHRTRNDAPAPSVEAILHAILPHKFVDHTHSDAVLTVTNAAGGGPGGADRVREIWGDAVVVIPYAMPGFALARLCARLFPEQAGPQTIGMVLLQHGIFSFGATARESYERMIELVSRAEEYLAAHGAWTLPEPAAEVPPPSLEIARSIASLRHDLSRTAGFPLIVTSRRNARSLSFARRDDVARISQQGPATSDHLIRTKSVPMLGRDAAAWAEQYHAYFEAHAPAAREPRTMLDPAPRLVLDRELGLLAAGRRTTDAAVAAEIYEHTMDIIERAVLLGGWTALPAHHLFDMEYWDLQQAKLKKEGTPPVFAGEIALITGAASGIGRACVTSLLERGAAVVGLDLNPAIESLHDRQDFLGIACDVTDEDGIKRVLLRTADAFGGLDMLILNAGIFPAGRKLQELASSEWRRVFQINLDSNLTFLREAHPFLALAPGRGRVVVIGSKNVPAPGPGAAAYSASKAALNQLARVAALEWGKDGIRVNVLHPNAVFDTAIWSDDVIAARAAAYNLDVDSYRRNNVLGVEVTSRDVAELAAAMCGPLFAKTTGAQVPVDGGNERVI